jgi:hypothetical protein
MTAGLNWLAAFPHSQAKNAVTAVRTVWGRLAGRRLPNYSPSTHEPSLTRILKVQVERVAAHEFGAIGRWGSEGYEDQVDGDTLTIKKTTRTDIQYSWNDNVRSYRLIFEFKRVDHRDSKRKLYCGDEGLLRFVNGAYSHKDAVAVMVAILTKRRDEAWGGLRARLQQAGTLSSARMLKCPQKGHLREPSDLFPGDVEFDTEHLRPPELAPKHGTIRIAHMCLEFPDDVLPVTKSKKKILDELEQD